MDDRDRDPLPFVVFALVMALIGGLALWERPTGTALVSADDLAGQTW